jgi:hypothetical protein
LRARYVKPRTMAFSGKSIRTGNTKGKGELLDKEETRIEGVNEKKMENGSCSKNKKTFVRLFTLQPTSSTKLSLLIASIGEPKGPKRQSFVHSKSPSRFIRRLNRKRIFVKVKYKRIKRQQAKIQFFFGRGDKLFRLQRQEHTANK